MKRFLSLLFVLLVATPSLVVADWPAWRGPTGQGFSSDKNLPLTWSETENVKWKIDLAHQGNSTPVIWRDKIFLTQADKDGKTRSLICFDRANGQQLWQKDVAYTEKERNWNPNWYCNASPMTDGERVVVSLGSAGVYCYDFTGTELWKRTDLGTWEHPFGNSASPVIYQDLVIQWCGPNEKGRNYLIAMNKKTGETVWEVDEKNGSWGTPLIAKVDGKDQLLLSTVPYLKGIEPKSGKELWFCEGLNKYVYTSPLYGNGFAVAMSGYTGAAFGVKLGGSGDITADRLWHHPVNIQRVGSGMLIDDHVYIVEENTVPHCYNVKTGEEVWKADKRLGGTNWGSMVHADGKLYVMLRNSSTVVLAASPNYELLATNTLGKEDTNSTPAISNGEIFLRTFKHLYCIAKPK